MDGKSDKEVIYHISESRTEAAAAIDAVVESAKSELRIFDSTAAAIREREFGRPGRIDMLRQMLIANRHHRLRIVLHETQGIESELPRLLALLNVFSAQIQIHRSTAAARDARDVMIIADDANYWRKPHVDHPRSILSLNDAAAAQPLVERFEEIWQNSEPAVGGTTAGL